MQSNLPGRSERCKCIAVSKCVNLKIAMVCLPFPLFHSLHMCVIVRVAYCLFIYSLNPCLNPIENLLLLDGMKSLDVRPHSFNKIDSSSAVRYLFPKAIESITSR
jgi:hypothetical protein